MSDQKKPGNALALMASRVMVSPDDLSQTLRETVFKGATDAEFVTLVAVANRYDLDPLARELYAFPKKGGGIVPLVPIDGWLKLIRSNPDFAGMDVRWADEMAQPAQQAKACPVWVEITIHHKSHPEHPTVHREWLDEMYRNTGPWNDTTKRMLEWKGINQAGRISFGLSGIYDQYEAERISDAEMIEGTATVVEVVGEADWQILVRKAEHLGYSADDITANAAALGFEGEPAEMPRDIANTLYKFMRENPLAGGPDDEPTSAPAETPSGDDTAQDEQVQAEAPSDAGDAAEASDAALSADDPEPPGMSGEDVKAKRRSASQIAQDLKDKAAAKDAAKPPSAAQQTMLEAKAAELQRLAGADAVAYVLRSVAGNSDDIAEVSGENAAATIEELQQAINRARAAGKGGEA